LSKSTGLNNISGYIVAQLDSLLGGDKATPYDLHLTGHSLGASYATLFHTGLLYLSSSTTATATTLPSSLVVRDLYTFGSPRLGLTDFAQLHSTLLSIHDGASWRIIDAHDPVTLVPPEPLHIGSEGWVFCHVDKAVKVQKDGSFVYVESEVQRGPDTLGVGGALLHFGDHCKFAFFGIMCLNT
jgi:predicted lipase